MKINNSGILINLLITISEVLVSILETNFFSFQYEADLKIKIKIGKDPFST